MSSRPMHCIKSEAGNIKSISRKRNINNLPKRIKMVDGIFTFYACLSVFKQMLLKVCLKLIIITSDDNKWRFLNTRTDNLNENWVNSEMIKDFVKLPDWCKICLWSQQEWHSINLMSWFQKSTFFWILLRFGSESEKRENNLWYGLEVGLLNISRSP